MYDAQGSKTIDEWYLNRDKALSGVDEQEWGACYWCHATFLIPLIPLSKRVCMYTYCSPECQAMDMLQPSNAYSRKYILEGYVHDPEGDK